MPINRHFIKGSLLEPTRKFRSKPRNLESPIQQACVRWFRMQYPSLSGVFFSVPNGGKRNAVIAMSLQKEGTLPGVSDLMLLVPNRGYHGLCIEMKADKGRQSDHQKAFQQAVQKQGYKYILCYSLDQFIKEIEGYLK